ncbi:hypothetical protein [Leucothrix arctica]|uniref:RES domain-containing protein n=1 Tax=Leucothrix arctica TaxID=1481894 RepID=A0A317C400_9GAMM|nr:hypothetical protein [Leucothrix arctica]PWQ93416.1 hypothetical protein DKT75_17455 [Leucothrix arctica]
MRVRLGNSDYREKASQDRQAAIAKDDEPTSWEVSDLLRTHQEIGLIDPSRKDPKAWHVTLFRWNESGAPIISLVGEPTPIVL